MMSPGRNPSRSPASTAGRVRMIRSTSWACRACTASATARYDFRPGRADPEGDDVGGDGIGVALLSGRLRTDGPAPAERSTSVVSTSEGLTSSLTMAMVRPMSAASSRWPCSSSTHELVEQPPDPLGVVTLDA